MPTREELDETLREVFYLNGLKNELVEKIKGLADGVLELVVAKLGKDECEHGGYWNIGAEELWAAGEDHRPVRQLIVRWQCRAANKCRVHKREKKLLITDLI